MATIIFLGLFVLMWIVLIVPRQREVRRHQALMGQLAVDDEVMLGAGIYGVITEIEDDYVRLEVAPGTELKVAKRAVAAKVPTPEPASPTGPAAGDPDGADHEDGADLADDRTEQVEHPDVAGA